MFNRSFIIIIILFSAFVFTYKQINKILIYPISHLTINEHSEKKYAIVSGQSIIGMLAAATLAKSGYDVDCFEIRKEYTRNIQWAARQSLVNELASIDEKLADQFLCEIAKPIYKGSTHIYPNGSKRNKSHEGLSKANAYDLPTTCNEMMSTPSVAILEAKKFEFFLRSYLNGLPNVNIHYGSIDLIKANEGYYSPGYRIPNLIVIAEGANSKSRDKLGIYTTPMAVDRLQIAGTIDLDGKGIMIKHWRQNGEEIHLTGVMGRDGSPKTWIVADIDPNIITSQTAINSEFKKLASKALEIPPNEIQKLKISGPIDGKPVSVFYLKQAICSHAFKGDNVILIGDAVGAGHWSVGGGMQTGSVCHIERLKTLLKDLELKVAKKQALKRYSESVVRDTETWIEQSAKDMNRSFEIEI